MPKRVFWPVCMIVMGLIFLASNLGLLPKSFWNLWPLILIVVGMGALVTSDRDEWMYEPSSSSTSSERSHSAKKAKKSSSSARRK